MSDISKFHLRSFMDALKQICKSVPKVLTFLQGFDTKVRNKSVCSSTDRASVFGTEGWGSNPPDVIYTDSRKLTLLRLAYSKYLHRINQGIRDGRGLNCRFCVLESISRCIRGGQERKIYGIRGGWVIKLNRMAYPKKTALSLKPTQNTPRGLEPLITGMRTRRPRPLDDGGKKIAASGFEPLTLGL